VDGLPVDVVRGDAGGGGPDDAFAGGDESRDEDGDHVRLARPCGTGDEDIMPGRAKADEAGEGRGRRREEEEEEDRSWLAWNGRPTTEGGDEHAPSSKLSKNLRLDLVKANRRRSRAFLERS
jgi:hypothetical protein